MQDFENTDRVKIIIDPIDEYRRLLKDDPMAAKNYYDSILTTDQQKQISQFAPGEALIEIRRMGEAGGLQFVEVVYTIPLTPKPYSKE